MYIVPAHTADHLTTRFCADTPPLSTAVLFFVRVNVVDQVNDFVSVNYFVNNFVIVHYVVKVYCVIITELRRQRELRRYT